MIPSQSSLIDPLKESVIVDTSKPTQPVCINLNKLFGSHGLQFIVAVEDIDMIEPVLIAVQGQLYLYPVEASHANGKTRLAIRAIDSDGDAVATTITIFVSNGEKPAVAAA